MDAVEGAKHQDFTDMISETGNTVCGRHPIGVVMAALEILEKEGKKEHQEDGRFKFVRYERSGLCQNLKDSSVSYCSAYAVLRGGTVKEVEATDFPIQSPSFKAALKVY
jgi:predicted class III extradiol MEMO1 family dioxygenase